MQKNILLVVCLVIPLSLADNKDEFGPLETLDNGKLDRIEIFDVDNSDENDSGQRKRESGYFYRKPDRPIKFESSSMIKGPRRYVTRLSTSSIKPFKQYGPPKQSSFHVIPNNHQIFRPQSQQHKNRYHKQQSSNNDVQLPDNNKLSENPLLNVPNHIRGIGLSSHPIASQNDVPFNHNTANYLPPKNQKLPAYSSNLPQRFNANINPQNSQRLIQQSQAQIHPLSDATQFLIQNSQAISKLYETPATNLNYEPTSDNSDGASNNQFPNLNSQFQTFDIASTQQSQQQSNTLNNQNSGALQLPSYSSGILATSHNLEKILAEEKERLIVQLQQALTSQRQISTAYATGLNQNPENYYETQKLLGKSAKSQNQDQQQDFNGIDVTSGQNIFQQRIPVTSYGTPVRPVSNQPPLTISLTTSTTSNNIPVHRPQSNTDTGSSDVPTLISTPNEQPVAPLSFPQSGGFVPTAITPTKILNSFPPHYSTTLIGTNSPNHFNIPITTTINNKPISEYPPSTSVSKPIFPSLPSTPPFVDHSTSLPIPSGHPISPPNSIQPVLSIDPASILLQKPTTASHPPYSIRPGLVNSIFLKPIKPVFPLYYYPNTGYQVQKSAVAVPAYPWSQTSASWQIKSNPSWK